MPQNLKRFEQSRPQRLVFPGGLIDNDLTQLAPLGRRLFQAQILANESRDAVQSPIRLLELVGK
jgi:hypothetical protein